MVVTVQLQSEIIYSFYVSLIFPLKCQAVGNCAFRIATRTSIVSREPAYLGGKCQHCNVSSFRI